ncbi:MAG: hypothetical protein V1913_08260, partial [Fibrobacterota bacterium]
AMLLCRKKYNLNLLGANFNHGFQTDIAVANLKQLSERLNVPITTVTPDFNVLYRLYREFLIKTGDFCTPCCQGCCRAGFIVARQNRIRTIFHGGVSGSRVEFNVLGMLRHHYERVMKVIGTSYRASELERLLAPTQEIQDFSLVSLPQYEEWDERKIIRRLKDEMGWQALPDGRTRHVDCIVADVSDHLLQKKFGFSKQWMAISANLRAGFLDVEEGHQIIKYQEAHIAEEPKEAMDYLLEKLKLTRKEVYALPYYKSRPVFVRL